jgi:hypothetical protein
MHDGVLAVKNPMIGVGPLDPHAGFIAGDNFGFAQNSLGFLGLNRKAGMRADEHVHQRALAEDQAKGVAEQEAQTLIGNRLKALQINRQRMNARSERRRRGDRRRRRFRFASALRAAAGKAPVTDDMRPDRRDLDLVVFADQFHVGVDRDGPAASCATGWSVVAELVGIVGKTPIVRLVPGLRPAGPRVLPPYLLVRRGRLRGGARGFLRSLQLQHQIDQFVLA